MKNIRLLYLFVLFPFLFASCEDDKTTSSVPRIQSLEITSGNTIMLQDTIFFSARVSDDSRPLSTLEVEVMKGDEVVYQKTIRTKGNNVELVREALPIAFLPNIKTGDNLIVNFTLINVDGIEVKEQKVLKAKRPDLPNKLFVVLANKDVIELNASVQNPFMYESEEGNYSSVFAAKLATDADLAKAAFIWNGANKANNAIVGERFGTDISISYPTWVVQKIRFNALSFLFDVEGQEVDLKIKDKAFTGKDGYFYAKINFVKGESFDITGIDNPELQYNRDFFSYDSGSKKFTFLQDSGEWEVFYSMTYKYFFVNKMDAVAPACLWIVGHGFASASQWSPEYGLGGWDTADPGRLGYAVSIGNNKYQASMYINNKHEWDSFEFEIYSDLKWGKAKGLDLKADGVKGNVKGFDISAGKGLTSGNGFVPGYYRLIFDASEGATKGSVEIERIY